MEAESQEAFEYSDSAVILLVDGLERELADRRNHLLFRITAWCVAVRVFKRMETENVVVLEGASDRASKYHRAILAFLRGRGELLVVELSTHQEVDLAQVGISFPDLEAMVEELKISERQSYGDMTEARRADILNAMHDAALRD